MATISVCMLAKNEERSINDSLRSVLEIADEIIVADTGSTDDTMKRVKKYGATIVKHVWKNDFSRARNSMLARASMDWIFMLDADEVVSHTNHRQLKSLLQRDAEAFFMPIRNYTDATATVGFSASDGLAECKRYKGFFMSSAVRLFKNNPAYTYLHPIHETINESILEYGGTIFATDIPIHHYGYTSLKKMKEKSQMYLATGLSHLKKNPKDATIHHEVGVLYKDKGNQKLAEFHLNQSIILGITERAPYNDLASLYLAQNNVTKAIQAYARGLAINANDDSIYHNLGMLYASQKEYTKSIEEFRKAIALCPDNPLYYEHLAQTLRHLGNTNEAVHCLKLALTHRHPDTPRIMKLLQSMRNMDITYNFSVS